MLWKLSCDLRAIDLFFWKVLGSFRMYECVWWVTRKCCKKVLFILLLFDPQNDTFNEKICSCSIIAWTHYTVALFSICWTMNMQMSLRLHSIISDWWQICVSIYSAYTIDILHSTTAHDYCDVMKIQQLWPLVTAASEFVILMSFKIHCQYKSHTLTEIIWLYRLTHRQIETEILS